MGLMDLLRQVTGSGVQPEQHYEQVAQAAPPEAVGKGLAAAFRSDQTPPFPEMIAQLFSQSDPAQRAGMLNQLLAALGPAVLAQTAGNALPAGTTRVTPDQASQLTPEQVQQMAAHAEQAHPGIIDQMGSFYAEHPTLVKTLGGAVLAVVLAKIKDHVQG